MNARLLEAEYEMLPYYHPTSIVMIDDDPAFLQSLAFSPVGDLPHAVFSRPDDALRFIFERQALVPRVDTFIVPHDGEIAARGADRGGRLLRIRSDHITELTKKPARFDMTSVAIVDFDMPSMNGLQFCRALANLPIRKLLLTGCAGVDTGVQALNDGIIDGYIVKQDRALIDALLSGITHQKQAFFSDITRPLAAALCWDELGFISDPAFAAEFQTIHASRDGTEYYVSSDPPGFLSVSRNGTAEFVVVYDENTLRCHVDVAREAGAEAELVDLLERRAVVPMFPNGSFFLEDYSDTWRQYVRPARRLVGDRTWYISVMADNDAQLAWARP
jgi:CheY-like chemotaxis protein